MRCDICNLQCKYPSELHKHLRTKSHRLKENPEIKPDLKCDVCNIKFLCKAEETRHMVTQKHAKNLAKTNSCGPAPVTVSAQE